MDKFKKKVLKYMCFLIFAILFISIFSRATSVLWSRGSSFDSATFQVIGRGMLKGLVPYKDLFDHKGPILFYIQALGCLINKDFGIYFLQIVNVFVTEKRAPVPDIYLPIGNIALEEKASTE